MRDARLRSSAYLKNYGISSIDECKAICDEKGIDPYTIVQETQPICFENAKWAYTVGCAIAIKEGLAQRHADAAAAISVSVFRRSAFPAPLPKTVRSVSVTATSARCSFPMTTECFCFLAGHESFAAAEGAIKIALNANKVRTKPLRVILNGLGKDAAYDNLPHQRFHLSLKRNLTPIRKKSRSFTRSPISKGRPCGR